MERRMDGVISICLRPNMYVVNGTVPEIVAWLDADVIDCGGVRTAPMNWPAFRQQLKDLTTMKPNELADQWEKWRDNN